MRRRTLLLGLTALAALGGAGLTWRSFATDLASARARIRGHSSTIEGRFGTLEYAQEGQGAPVLMIHGTGGGFDQGLDMARPLTRSGFRLIAPSRFGYLRSAYPAYPSSENQADAFVDLLDHLKVARAHVIGGSAGALSAMQFAIRHPDRCSALVALVPAAYAPGRPPVDPPTPLAKAIIEYALRSDFLFWTGLQIDQDAMISALLATDPALVRRAGTAEQARVRSILHNILPISDRASGLLNDGRLAYTPAPMPLERITAPTLALSFEDDKFQTAAAARHIAATVKNGKLVIFPEGGHIWAGQERNVFDAIAAFLKSIA